jgi:hypothetical protein
MPEIEGAAQRVTIRSSSSPRRDAPPTSVRARACSWAAPERLSVATRLVHEMEALPAALHQAGHAKGDARHARRAESSEQHRGVDGASRQPPGPTGEPAAGAALPAGEFLTRRPRGQGRSVGGAQVDARGGWRESESRSGSRAAAYRSPGTRRSLAVGPPASRCARSRRGSGRSPATLGPEPRPIGYASLNMLVGRHRELTPIRSLLNADG